MSSQIPGKPVRRLRAMAAASVLAWMTACGQTEYEALQEELDREYMKTLLAQPFDLGMSRERHVASSCAQGYSTNWSLARLCVVEFADCLKIHEATNSATEDLHACYAERDAKIIAAMPLDEEVAGYWDAAKVLAPAVWDVLTEEKPAEAPSSSE